MRELLKEARDMLQRVYETFEEEYREAVKKYEELEGFSTVPFRHVIHSVELEQLLPRIDSALSAPDESAMEKVRRIRSGSPFSSDGNPYLTDAEAAALIEPSVPREMLCEVYDRGYYAGLCDKTQDYYFSDIAAKHGVKVKEATALIAQAQGGER